MERTPIQKLDAVLSFLNRDTTWLKLRTAFPDSEIPKEEMKTILRKLYRDKYADRFSGLDLVSPDSETGYVNESRIVRNFEGDLFAADGGYSTTESSRRSLELLAIAQSRMTRLSFWVNFSIAVSTGVAAIFYLSELYWKHQWFQKVFPPKCQAPLWIIVGIIFLLVFLFSVNLYRKNNKNKT